MEKLDKLRQEIIKTVDTQKRRRPKGVLSFSKVSRELASSHEKADVFRELKYLIQKKYLKKVPGGDYVDLGVLGNDYLYPSKFGKSQPAEITEAVHKITPGSLKDLHKSIQKKCQKLYEDGHYGSAADKALRVVRDRLLELTGFETGSEAFGKGNL
jgi:hypothetical protein